jgi:hypothetical protein
MTAKTKAQPTQDAGMQIEQVPIDSLTPHARNFRQHPPAQLSHLQASLREYGWARNVVVSRDNVILAGHGIVEAARKEGHATVPVYRLNLKGDDPKAEKFLVLENTVSRLAEDDDTQLAALLADVQRTEGLDGTGYTDGDLDALIAEMAGVDLLPMDDAEGTGSRGADYRNPDAVIVAFGDLAAVAVTKDKMQGIAAVLATMYEGTAREQLGALLDDLAAASLHRDG